MAQGNCFIYGNHPFVSDSWKLISAVEPDSCWPVKKGARKEGSASPVMNCCVAECQSDVIRGSVEFDRFLKDGEAAIKSVVTGERRQSDGC